MTPGKQKDPTVKNKSHLLCLYPDSFFFPCNITGSTREAQWAWLIKETTPLQAETAALLWAKMENWSRVIFEGLF